MYMADYNIKDLEKLSRILAHTIRIWEKRYNIFSPDRTPTNRRKYSDDDLRQNPYIPEAFALSHFAGNNLPRCLYPGFFLHPGRYELHRQL